MKRNKALIILLAIKATMAIGALVMILASMYTDNILYLNIGQALAIGALALLIYTRRCSTPSKKQ